MSPRPPSVNAAMLGRIEASIMAESAVVDKETGRVFWEGGDSSTLSASLHPRMGVLGFSHTKSAVLTSLLLLVLVSFLAQWIQRRMDAHPQKPTTETTTPLYKSVALFVLQRTLLKTPNLDRTFVICVFLLYLLEAYTCTTRRYLANAITSPEDVEKFLEQLRNQAPVITWKVRCFHYTPIWKLFQSREKKIAAEDKDAPMIQNDDDNVSGPFRRKVISHQAKANYTFGRFVDATIAGVWKRQEAISDESAPFMKIVLSKILVLANEDARKDYFKQQSNFVTSEGMRDRFAEYSTNIEVPGFKRRMLAIRPVKGVPGAKMFRLTTFWIFTLLGLSLPYRIWFAQRCDKVRVTVVKETYADVAAKSSSYFNGWFSSSSKPVQTSALPATSSNELFRQQMQALLLYAQQEEVQQQSALNALAPVGASVESDAAAATKAAQEAAVLPLSEQPNNQITSPKTQSSTDMDNTYTASRQDVCPASTDTTNEVDEPGRDVTSANGDATAETGQADPTLQSQTGKSMVDNQQSE